MWYIITTVTCISTPHRCHFERNVENNVESKLTTVFSLSGSVEDVGLTYEEENAIHYVGGYVIRQLNVVNRGGLTRITNEAFKGFCDIEIIIRRFLCIDERNE